MTAKDIEVEVSSTSYQLMEHATVVGYKRCSICHETGDIRWNVCEQCEEHIIALTNRMKKVMFIDFKFDGCHIEVGRLKLREAHCDGCSCEVSS